MGLLFYGTSAANGFDSVGHYVRTEALVGGCTGYAKVTIAGCSANFTHQTAAADIASKQASASNVKLQRVVRDARASGLQASTTGALSGLLRYLIGSGR